MLYMHLSTKTMMHRSKHSVVKGLIILFFCVIALHRGLYRLVRMMISVCLIHREVAPHFSQIDCSIGYLENPQDLQVFQILETHKLMKDYKK